MKEQSYYMIIPSEVWDAEISAKAMILYGHISVLANKQKYCFAGNDYFETVMKMSQSTLNRCFKELEDLQLIRREVIYKEGSKEIEQRKIFLNIGIIKNEYSPIIKNEYAPIITDDLDNITRDNNTRDNITDDERLTLIKNLFWKKLVPLYPINRIGNRQHAEKKWLQLEPKDMKLAIKNINRYLELVDGYVKSLQNYLTEKCFTEEWLTEEERNKIKKTHINNDTESNVKTFKDRDANFF